MISYADIKPFHEGSLTVAAGCGVPEIDDNIRFKRNLTIIGGIGNVGKTTAWMYVLFIWASKHPDNLKFLMFLNENDEKEMAMQMIEWYNAKWITDQTKHDIDLALNWVNEHFRFLENDYKSTLEMLMKRFVNIKKGTNNEEQFEYDGIFVDPYNSLPVYKGYIEHYENASKFRGFVKKQNVKLMVSMHANTEAQRKRDEDGRVKVPHIADLEMGSMWFNRGDDCVMIHRQIQIEEEANISEIHVQKIKHKRSGGNPTPHDAPIKMTWEVRKAGRFFFDNEDVVDIPLSSISEVEFKQTEIKTD